MPNTDFIDQIVSTEAYQNVEKADKAIDSLYESILKATTAANGFVDSLGKAGGLKQFTDEQKKLNKENEKIIDLDKQIKTTITKRIVAEQQLAKELASQKILLQQQNKDNAIAAKIQQTTAGSLARLEAVVTSLRAKQRNLNLTTEEGQKKSEQYKKQIDRINEAIRSNSDAAKQQSLNVGNYAGSAKLIVDALERARLKSAEFNKQFGQTSPEATAARNAVEALQRVVDQPQFLNVSSKFQGTNKELRFFTQQLQQLKASGAGADVIASLEQKLGTLTDEIGDTREKIKALSSDTRSFDLFAGSVTFAADAFQTFAGAAQLAGQSQEDVAKVTADLVAVQAFANGVKGIANELTTKGTAANKVFAFTQGLITKAMGQTTGAARVLRGALIATGIGALIVAIGALIANFDDLKDKIFGVSKAQKDIAKNAEEAANQEAKKLETLEDQENTLKLQGKTEEQILALKVSQTNEVIAQREQQLIAQQELLKSQIQAAQRNRDILSGILQFIGKPVKFLIGSIFRLKNTVDNIFGKGVSSEVFEKNLDEAFKAANDKIAGFIFDPAEVEKEGQETLQETLSVINQLKNQRDGYLLSQRKDNKKAAGERAKDEKDIAKELNDFLNKLDKENIEAKQEFLNLYGQNVADNLKRISDNEQLGLNERLIANTAFYVAQEELIKKKAAQEQQAILDAAKLEAEGILGRKIDPSKDADLLLQIQKATAGKRILIQQDAENKIVEVRRDGLNRQTEITNQEVERQVDALGRTSEARLRRIDTDEQAENLAVEKSFQAKKITFEQYEKQKLNIQNKYLALRLQAELESSEQLLAIAKASGIDTGEAERKIADIKLKIAQQTTKDLEEENKKQADKDKEYAAKKKELLNSLYSELKNTVFGFFDNSFEKQKNNLQQEINLVDQRSGAEIERINRLQISEEEKANKIRILEAQTDNQKKLIEQRQKAVEIQQARFAKTKAAFEIGINTAIGISKVVPNPVLIALVAAIGAVQLAAVLSAPVPQYYTGTEDSKGGLAWLGERGKELLITPDNKMFETPNSATLANIPAHSTVINNTEYMKMLKDEGANGVFKEKPMNDRQFIQWQIKNAEIQAEKIVKAINNKPEAVLNISDYGIAKFKQQGQSWTEYLNSRRSFKK